MIQGGCSLQGKIIKAISGFYYVHSEGNVWTCKAKGVFRNLGIKPLVGDDVLFDAVGGGDYLGNLTKVLPRRNVLIRPATANIDQAMIVFAVKEPDPSFNLLDRFLVYMGMQDIPCVVYFNKTDLLDPETVSEYRSVYEKAGCTVITGSTRSDDTIREVKEALKGKTTVLAGPSGAGKSSLTNRIYEGAGMVVGELSQKIKRGKQTTRHTELFAMDEESFFLDTPGFTSLYVQGVPSDELRYYFHEFEEAGHSCRFNMCSHVNEPEELCQVKQEVKKGSISRIRYDDYCQIYKEVKENEHTY